MTRQGEQTYISNFANADIFSFDTILVFIRIKPGAAYNSIVDTTPRAIRKVCNMVKTPFFSGQWSVASG